MKPRRTLTVPERARIKALHAEGRSLAELGRQFDCDPVTINRVVDTAWAAERQKRVNAARIGKEMPSIAGREVYAAPSDIAARLAEIPPDTRSLTGIICGDPLPAMSALARKMGAGL